MSLLIPWPTTNPYLAFESYTLKLSRHTTLMQSPFTGKRQSMAQPFALWGFSGKFAKLDLQNAASLRSFLAQLSGQANKFKLPIPDAQYPQSGYTGVTGFVNGANQTGTSLVTNGWIASSLILNDGDYFTVNDELKKCIGYAMSDGGGACTINFVPPIKYSPADTLQLFIGNPRNLLTNSNSFAMSSWGKTNATIAGGNVFTRTATGNCYMYESLPQNTAYNFPHTFSISMKQGTLTGAINIVIQDANGGNFQSFACNPNNSSYTRYSITGSLPTGAPLPMQVGINPQNMSGSAGDTLFLSNAQLETGAGGKSYSRTTTGDGQPYCVMFSTNDDAASWDLSPPIVYDVKLDAMESFE